MGQGHIAFPSGPVAVALLRRERAREATQHNDTKARSVADRPSWASNHDENVSCWVLGREGTRGLIGKKSGGGKGSSSRRKHLFSMAMSSHGLSTDTPSKPHSG